MERIQVFGVSTQCVSFQVTGHFETSALNDAQITWLPGQRYWYVLVLLAAPES